MVSLMKTEVCHLLTGIRFTYTLPPNRAVINAWYQHYLNNWNTWTYDYHDESLPLFVGERHISCGDFCARASYRCRECAHDKLDFTEGYGVWARCPSCCKLTFLWPLASFAEEPDA
jgi:hypothetical protein